MFTETRSRRTIRRIIGAVDALAAPHGVDRYLEQVAPTWSSTEVRGRVTRVDRSATDAVVLTIEANGNWTGFRAGQYTQLSVEIDGVRHTRCYSMASAAPAVRPGPSRASRTRTFQLGIKAHPQGMVSRHLVATAAPGLVVGLTPAAGDFHLPDTRPDRVVLISGGSGITPVLSMLRTLVAEGFDGPIAFVHYALTPRHVLFATELAAIARRHPNVRVVHGFQDEPGAGDVVGFLDPSHLDAADAGWRDAEIFVCGPGPLMDSVRVLCADAGGADRFHQEAFTLPVFVGEAGDVGGTLRLAGSDVTIDNDGRPILAQAEGAALSPQSGCRMGICHTCVRSLTSGTVRDVVTGDLTTATGSAVDIRICVSAPVGDADIDL